MFHQLYKIVDDAKRRADCKNETRYVVSWRGRFTIKTKIEQGDEVMFVCVPGQPVQPFIG